MSPTAERSLVTTVALALIAIGVAGCGSDDTKDGAPVASLTRAQEGDGKAQTKDTEARSRCPNPEGGQCLGQLDPGTHTTLSFSPAITYTVPSGWTNGEDLAGNFLLQRDGDERYVGIYQDANAPDGCAEHPDPDVSQSVADYTRWLRKNPLLRVTKPSRVSIGGLNGVAMDISRARGSEGRGCTYDALEDTAPFIVGGRACITSFLTRPAGRSACTCSATSAATSRSKSAPKAPVWRST